MRKNIFRLFILFLIINENLQAIDKTQLSIDIEHSLNLVTRMNDQNELEISTIGKTGILKLSRFDTTIPIDRNILSFEYFSTTGIEGIYIKTNNEDLIQNKEKTIVLPISEGWSTYSVDIGEQLKGHKQAGNQIIIIIHPINCKKTIMRIRNIHLRSLTVKEKYQLDQRNKRSNILKHMEKDLNDYLHKDYDSKISSVEAYENKIIIKGKTYENSNNLFLCEVPIFYNLTEKEFLQKVPIKNNKKFKLEFSRKTIINGQQYDRLYSRWVIGRKTEHGFQIVSHGHYADKIESKYDYKAEKVRNKKGIGGFLTNLYVSDLDSLQISSVTVNIWLDHFLRLTPGKDNIPFEYNNHMYYADKKFITSLDRNLLTTASRGIIVNAIILISPEKNSRDKAIGKLMEHPDFNSAGIYTMPNMTTLKSTNIYAAAIDFLASRYGRDDQKYGRIHNWIVHNEVDAGWVWTNAGIKTEQIFMDDYIKSMRLIYLTARKYNPNSEVLISLTHHWKARHNKYCYPSARIMELLLDYTRTEGDFKWGVAMHPYPQDLFEPKTWLDKGAKFSYDTPYITFKNLEVIDAWIKRPETLYKGKEKRTLFLSEQNPNSRDYSEKSLNEQAACMAYVWKKLQRLDGIDAYQMHGWFDHREEGGLRIGIRKFTDDISDPSGRKPAWFIFRDACTDKEEDSFNFAKRIIGINSWEDIFYKGKIK